MTKKPDPADLPDPSDSIIQHAADNPDEEGQVTLMFDQMQAGNELAAAGLWNYFFPRLVRLADSTLSGKSRRAVDAEDAAQVAFFKFWEQSRTGSFAGELRRENLWNLLSTITIRQAVNQVHSERAQKRGGGNVVEESAIAGAGKQEFNLDQSIGELPSQEFELYCEELLMSLDHETRAVALLKLMGYKNAEIAELRECSERQVERLVKSVREKLAADGD